MHTTYAIHSLKGLHWQICALTAKLMALPSAKPPIKQKLAMVAATSTSSVRPPRRLLCCREGAAIIHKLDVYPLVRPNSNRMRKKSRSEFMKGASAGGRGDGADGRWTLQRRKSGMKIVRANESPRSFLGDQMRRRGTVQSMRPPRSPTLKRRK